jgi:hypothetical protein
MSRAERPRQGDPLGRREGLIALKQFAQFLLKRATMKFRFLFENGDGFVRHIANTQLSHRQLPHAITYDGILSDEFQFMVGIEKSAPSLTPDGQREVTVLVLV